MSSRITDDEDVKTLLTTIEEFAGNVARGDYGRGFGIDGILATGKRLWDAYDLLSRPENPNDVAAGLTRAADKIVAVIVDLAHQAPSSPKERTDKLVEFVNSTNLRGRILAVENAHLMSLAAFKPLKEELVKRAAGAGKGFEEYFDDRKSKHWFSTNYNPTKESSFEESDDKSSVFTCATMPET
jgi:hypothetical protein